MVDDPTQYEGLTPFEALEAAIKILGSQPALAAVCGVTGTAVWKWVQSGKRLPAEHVLAVEEATGIPCYVLNPDIYPPARFRASSRFYGVDEGGGQVCFIFPGFVKPKGNAA